MSVIANPAAPPAKWPASLSQNRLDSHSHFQSIKCITYSTIFWSNLLFKTFSKQQLFADYCRDSSYYSSEWCRWCLVAKFIYLLKAFRRTLESAQFDSGGTARSAVASVGIVMKWKSPERYVWIWRLSSRNNTPFTRGNKLRNSWSFWSTLRLNRLTSRDNRVTPLW